MAYECSPYRGSEWAVGWGRLVEAARVAEVHVVTSEANYAALVRARDEGLMPAGVTFHSPEPDVKLRKLELKPALFAYNYTAYHYWQVLAMRLVRGLHARERFDLVHQVTVQTFREPGYTWELGIPYVWGPVGGTQNFPWRFLSMLPLKEALKEGIRGVSNWLSLRTKRRVRQAARAAAMIAASNSTNKRDFERVFRRPVELLLETGLWRVSEPDRSRFAERFEDQRAGRPLRPLRILWSGELQSRKALPILLRALSGLKDVAWELTVLGDGPMRELWIQEAVGLGLTVVEAPKPGSESPYPGHPTFVVERGANVVCFLGRLPFAEAVAKMQEAELFVFSSLRDTSGNVVLEALAAGVPVVCFDHQGVGDMVTEECGVKIGVTSPKWAVDELAAVIGDLAEDGERLLKLSLGATERAKMFLWECNGNWINAAYKRLASESVNA